MTRIIPNENCWIGFADDTGVTDPDLEPTAAEIVAAIPLTAFIISINASSTGNTVPTPSLDTLFETSISGTVTAAFTADMYRDDEDDTAWETLPRRTKGYFIISRFGGSGTDALPIAADVVEVWPVIVTSRSMANMSNNTAETFTVTCSVPQEPNEAAVVAA